MSSYATYRSLTLADAEKEAEKLFLKQVDKEIRRSSGPKSSASTATSDSGSEGQDQRAKNKSGTDSGSESSSRGTVDKRAPTTTLNTSAARNSSSASSDAGNNSNSNLPRDSNLSNGNEPGLDHFEVGSQRFSNCYRLKRFDSYQEGEIEAEFLEKVQNGDLAWVLDCLERVADRQIIYSKWAGGVTKTCLLYAIQNKDELMVRLLLHFGGRELLDAARDFKGRSGYDFALKSGLELGVILGEIESARIDTWRRVKKSEAFRVRARIQ
mmetsp:Transcript_27734/g.69965  ORF Transcript_27734/g.69965 Transcript_27734/m.69965 type:complete len:268 (+) Transcript_27734:143-946(+)|eukprot:CAMPEP_0178993092 /NCGR_PEP_ID=MMETSP0795-20121207/6499_1 /TAXON_ID=88552 /ORGANISM="Amoebophrya sp., Strain Ameob2" /LENGTH=267 /DNA_ID=CAMNT_0020685089 /DNA_START=43 /DNA_END=846 /DNA_ORIENTATION=+